MTAEDIRIVLGYFPNALACVAEHCRQSNEKHNPGEPVHWAFEKSPEHVMKAIGHLARAGTPDDIAFTHTVPGAWRALAALETELIKGGAKPGELVVL